MDERVERVIDGVSDAERAISLASEERLIAADEVARLRDAERKGADAEVVLGLMVRSHGVAPEAADGLRRKLARPTGRVIERSASVAPAEPTPAEPTPTEENGEAALVIFPSQGGDPTPAQCKAMAGALGQTEYEARLRFREPLPRVASVGPTKDILAQVDALRAAGIEATAFERGLILGELKPFRVREVRMVDGWLHLLGPRGEVRVDPARPILLVAGRFDFEAKAAPGYVGQAKETVHFGHLYAGATSDPYELYERDLMDFEVLGAGKSMIRRENFGKLLELIRGHAGVTFDDAMLRHSARLKECAFASTSVANVSSNMGSADILSRVKYHLWRMDRGVGEAALASALEVVSVREAPEERVAGAFGGGPTAMGPDGHSRMGGITPGVSAAPATTHASARARAIEACGACGPRRPVPPSGRCGACGRVLAATTARGGGSLGWYFWTYWNLVAGLLCLAIGSSALYAREAHVAGHGVVLGAFLLAQWVAKYFFGVTARFPRH